MQWQNIMRQIIFWINFVLAIYLLLGTRSVTDSDLHSWETSLERTNFAFGSCYLLVRNGSLCSLFLSVLGPHLAQTHACSMHTVTVFVSLCVHLARCAKTSLFLCCPTSLLALTLFLTSFSSSLSPFISHKPGSLFSPIHNS